MQKSIFIHWQDHLQQYSTWQSYRHILTNKITHSVIQPVLQGTSHRGALNPVEERMLKWKQNHIIFFAVGHSTFAFLNEVVMCCSFFRLYGKTVKWLWLKCMFSYSNDLLSFWNNRCIDKILEYLSSLRSMILPMIWRNAADQLLREIQDTSM